VAYWLKNYKDIGEKAEYSPREIEAYGVFIEGVANLMGVII
jgi:hypothetical protein